MTSIVKTAKKQLLTSQIARARSQNNEQLLKQELRGFFQKLKEDVLKNIDEFWNDSLMFQAHADLILSAVHEAHREYYNILEKYNRREYQYGQREAGRLTKLSLKNKKNRRARLSDKSQTTNLKPEDLIYTKINKDELFATRKWSEQKLLNQSFLASENTMNRIDNSINKILADGYKSGKGINHVRDEVNKRFEQLKSWEATRIARTEIHNAHQMGMMNDYEERGVSYTEWVSVDDGRTRGSKPNDLADHIALNGEIIPLDGKYSNGLSFPGDTSGPIEEWINCRCSQVPFIMPYGYTAPSFSPFRESDIVPTLDLYGQDELLQQFADEATTEAQQQQPQAQPPVENIPKIEGYDKYALTEAEITTLDELQKLQDEGGLKLKDKRRYTKLNERKQFSDMWNEILKDGGDPHDIFSYSVQYEKLYKKFKDWEPVGNVKIAEVKIDTQNTFQEEFAFKLTAEEKKAYKSLKADYSDLSPELKEYYKKLDSKRELNGLHRKLIKEGLDVAGTERYIKRYAELKKLGVELPEIPLTAKFATPTPSWEQFTATEVEIGKKYDLTKQQYQQLHELEIKKLMSENELPGVKISESELRTITDLQNQRQFNLLYYMKKGEGGLPYDSAVKFKELFNHFEKKLNLDKKLLVYELPKYDHKIKPGKITEDTHVLKLKGKNEDGLPPGYRIKDLFTIDVTKATINERRVVTRWMGNDFVYFRDFLVRSKGDINKYVDYIMNASDEQLKHYGYVKTLVENGDVKGVKSHVTDIAKSINHDLPVLDNILNNNVTKKAMTLWRKEQRHHLGENPKPGDIVTFVGKNSTAITLEGAEHFGEVTHRQMEWTYEIEAPAGTHGAYVSHLHLRERIRQEMEFLLADDTEMEIITFSEKRKYAKLRIITRGSNKSVNMLHKFVNQLRGKKYVYIEF